MSSANINFSSSGNARQQQRPPRGTASQAGQPQQPQYPSPPSVFTHMQRSPRSNAGAHGQHRGAQPLPSSTYIDVSPPSGKMKGGIPLAATTLSTSPTATTSSLPSSPSKTSSLDTAMAFNYDSSTYPPPEHSNAASWGKPSLGSFQKQLEARNRHRRRSQSMDPKRQGLPKQRTQTAAAISAAAGEMGNWDRGSNERMNDRGDRGGWERGVPTEGKGSRGKGSQRLAGKGLPSMGRGGVQDDREHKTRTGGKSQARKLS